MKVFNQGNKKKSKTPDNGFSDNELKFFAKRTELMKLIENTLSVIINNEDLNNNYNIVGKELLADAFMMYMEYELNKKEKSVIESMTNINTSYNTINEILSNLNDYKVDYIEYNKFMELMDKFTTYSEFEILVNAKYENLTYDDLKYKLDNLSYINNRNPKNEASNLIRKVLLEKLNKKD